MAAICFEGGSQQEHPLLELLSCKTASLDALGHALEISLTPHRYVHRIPLMRTPEMISRMPQHCIGKIMPTNKREEPIR
ncbi:hypothetical protein HYFRA_00004302 [Hymenoscyphus fraxineus]|uniref:Uncharacterized protein n=1 Tax=Hymenoscyphus fraxineus TaxID=746836 RepID=A0A9N9PNG4_9HELO|nr:hypothetical protein HYFRA_00004302 [Hymenoscyphus fraxineus]